MKRAWLLAGLVGCSPARVANEQAIVAPKPVVAKPIEVVGESSSYVGDVAPFELAIGTAHLCVRIEGKVYCGVGDDAHPITASPPIGGIDDATSLALGVDYGCVTTRRGTVQCWGSNLTGQLGAKLAVERSEDPFEVVGVTKAKRVFAGQAHACATTTDGGLFCWGLNQVGETGGATSWAPAARELATPNRVLVRDVTSVALSYQSTCALTKGGQSSVVYCWGASFVPEQQQAQGHTNEQPFPIAAIKGMDDLAAGSGAFCGVRNGEVSCVGSTYSYVPDAEREHDRDAPAKVRGVGGVTKVRLGGSHACALTRDGRVLCWGYDASGELGRAEPSDPNAGYQPKEPQPVPGIAGARDLVVARAASCAVMGAEEVWCWGLLPPARQERSPVRIRVR
jgi:alpha-tubulin suppressor-like RCC1 family protein